MNDHDRMVQITERVDTILTMLTNHLRHHFAVNIALMTAVLGAVASILVLIVKQ